MEKLNLNAITVAKFKDYDNHNYPAIKFQDINTKSTFVVFFINEQSSFYDIIQIGDTVIKKTESLEFESSNHKLISPLIYDCDEKKLK